MVRLSAALQISVEELLSPPPVAGRLYSKGSLPVSRRERGQAVVHKLLPDPIPGMEIDRMVLRPGARLAGVPHRPGTREYLFCETGQIVLWSAGARYDLSTGDLCAFEGDQPHSYVNPGRKIAVGFSVVTLAPMVVGFADG